jgi:hypothetical protein
MQSSRKPVQIFSEFGKDIALVVMGTLASYFFVQIITFFIMKNKIELLFDYSLFIRLFSFEMIPTLVSYGVLIAAMYYLYLKTKRVMTRLHEHELQRERDRTIVQTTQRLTGMMVHYIASYNTELRDWIRKKADKGEQPPAPIVKASDNIARALFTLSELSFVIPYGRINVNTIDDYARYLEHRLGHIEKSVSFKPSPLIT